MYINRYILQEKKKVIHRNIDLTILMFTPQCSHLHTGRQKQPTRTRFNIHIQTRLGAPALTVYSIYQWAKPRSEACFMSINTIPNDLESTSSSPSYKPFWGQTGHFSASRTSGTSEAEEDCEWSTWQIEWAEWEAAHKNKEDVKALSVSSKLLGLPPC